jgi:HEAT repeat protein
MRSLSAISVRLTFLGISFLVLVLITPVAIGGNLSEMPSEVRDLVKQLSSTSAIERGKAAHSLGRMGMKAAPAVPFLVKTLGDSSKLVWQSEWQRKVKRDAFGQVLGKKTSPGDEATKALSRIGKPAVKPLITALKDENPKVRERAARALGNNKYNRALQPLVSALSDNTLAVRKAAAVALGKMKDPRAVQPLASALKKETSPHGGYTIAMALGSLGESSIEPLLRLLRENNPKIRMQAVRGLGKTKNPRIVDAVITALQDEDAGVRVEAVWALGDIGGSRIVDPLIEALKDESRGVRARAAKKLGKLKNKKAIIPLIAALRSETDKWTRDDFRRALQSTTGVEYSQAKSFSPNDWERWWQEHRAEFNQ